MRHWIAALNKSQWQINGFVWCRIGTSDRLLLAWQKTFQFHPKHWNLAVISSEGALVAFRVGCLYVICYPRGTNDFSTRTIALLSLRSEFDWCWDSSVGIVVGYWLYCCCLIAGRTTSQRPERLSGPQNLSFNGYRVVKLSFTSIEWWGQE
jgi:hypothetical protein